MAETTNVESTAAPGASASVQTSDTTAPSTTVTSPGRTPPAPADPEAEPNSAPETPEQPIPEPSSEIATEDTKEGKKDGDTETADTANSAAEEKPEQSGHPNPIVSSSKKSRPAYKYDPNKVTLRFLFANRDGLTVTLECEPSDTVGEVKAALMSVWPEGEYQVCFVCLEFLYIASHVGFAVIQF